MAATLELKYFNSFWLKKMKTVVNAVPVPPAGAELNYPNLPYIYPSTEADDWYVEEARIRGGYNNTTVDLGVKAFLAEEDATQQTRISSLIYSGLFNSRTGVNNTNQFSVGKDITKSADPANGSIQKLYAEDTNLIIFQQDKVSRALIDKDAIYSAEGNATVTSSMQVIGQIVAYAGEYGISDNPESFAVYGYRKYFTDRKRNAVLRLSTNGQIVEISSFGMHDFFRDQLSSLNNVPVDANGNVIAKVRGGFDFHTKNYVLSIQNQDNSYITSSFDEDVKGWTSFFTYKPSFVASLNSNFYSFYTGKLYKHHSGNYGNFYGQISDSNVTVILNSQPSTVKVFQTINYEGKTGWEMQSMEASSGDASLAIGAFVQPTSLSGLETQVFSLQFKKKENKFFANLQQQLSETLTPEAGEVLWGSDVSGIKGFWSTIVMTLNNTTYSTTKKELFAVSSDTVESSY
jgi:hypothetical protein